MTNALVPVSGGGSVLYKKMQTAIAQCYSIDDCKHIVKQAGAIAAYYKQIRDDESVRKFLQVKIRAWRRIGEILVASKVDKSECNTLGDGSFNTAEYIRKIRAAFKGQKDVEALTDSDFRQALKIAELPKDFFERNVAGSNSVDQLVGEFARVQRIEWEATPEGQAELKEWKERQKRDETERKKWELMRAKELAEEAKKKQEQLDQRAREAAEVMDLKRASDEAFEDVGFTMDRRDREEMHQIVFLLKKPIYKVLRQAAFDQRTTMQSILRQGLMMWFIAHGYNVPTDDMQLPRRDDQPPPRGRRT